jgi:hypothetical protein
MLCGLAPLDIIAVRWAIGLPAPALARPAEARCILAAFDLAVTALLVSALDVSALLVSALGSTTAGRSTYFGVSAACGASALFDVSLTLAGAALVSTPPSERLRSPACAAAEARTNPAMKMNLRIFLSPREVDGETKRGDPGLM